MNTDDLIQGRIIKDCRNKSLDEVLKVVQWNEEQYADKVDWSIRNYITQLMSSKGPAFVLALYVGEKIDDKEELLKAIITSSDYLPRHIINSTIAFISLYFLFDGVPRKLIKDVNEFLERYCSQSEIGEFMNKHPECNLKENNNVT